MASLVERLVRLRLSLVRLRQGGVRRKVEEARAQRTGHQYAERPRVTLIVQFFNKRANVPKLLPRLRETSAEELIVIDDGSVDGSYEDWPRYLDRPNDFLLRANDLFEVRTYDRAISMARGDIVCLLQDDDLPPPGGRWLEDALDLFEALPDLVILGGRDGLDLLMPDPPRGDGEARYQRVGDVAGTPGVQKYRVSEAPVHVEPRSGVAFSHVMVVNRAPMFVRRAPFLELGGIDQEFAPYQCDDVDECIRAWLGGGRVGLYASGFERDVGLGGMRLFNEDRVPEQAARNWRRVYRKHGAHIESGRLKALVDESNEALAPQPAL